MNTLLGRTIQYPALNLAGTGVAYGDIVLLASQTASAFILNTKQAYVSGTFGVVLEPAGIAANAIGLVSFGGYVPKVNLSTFAYPDYLFTSSNSQKLATPHSQPLVAGDFGRVLGTGTTPPALLFGFIYPGIEYPWFVQIIAGMPSNAQTGFTTFDKVTGLGGADVEDGQVQSSGSQNDYIEWKILLNAGTWELFFNYLKNNNNGIYTVTLDGVTIATIDAYAASLASAQRSITSSIVVGSTGQHLLRFTMATKNGSSSNYYGQLQYIQIRRTA